MAARERIAKDKSPEEIRVDIERTRSHLDDTVDAIGDKLSPGRFVDEVWTRVQSEGASAVAHTLREHPIPFTLVGAGLGWLVYERASGRADSGRGRLRARRYLDWDGENDAEYEARDDERYAYDREVDEGEGLGGKMRHAKESLQEAGSRVRRSAAEAGHDVREKASAAAESVTDKLSDAKESVSETTEAAARGVRHGAERAREGFWHMLERNPIAVGAIALGAGLAAGLGAPRSRWEDERMGRAARSFKRETKQVMEETAGKVMGVAEEAYEAARAKSGEVMQEVKDAARERSREEVLTAEGVMEAAARPAQAARREAEK